MYINLKLILGLLFVFTETKGKIANMDMLTEAMNRNAYEDMVKYLEESYIKLRTTGVVLFLSLIHI